jgi:hypothetical protein
MQYRGSAVFRSLPNSVLLAGAVPSVCQLVQLVVLSPKLIAIVGLGLTVAGALLLAARSSLGWFLTMFWAASVVAAPFLFAAPLWPAFAGVLVASALMTSTARACCFRSTPISGVADNSVAEGRMLADRISKGRYAIAESMTPSQISRLVEEHIPRSFLSRRNVFLFFLGATFILLPLSGVLTKLHRGSGHSDPLVDIGYHLISVCSTLAQLGLIVTFLMFVSALLRSRAH